jgi:hypothetical protein
MWKNALLKQANDIWSYGSTGEWTTEASTFEALPHEEVICPACRQPLRANFRPERNQENEILAEHGQCQSCGAKLTIYND